MGKSENISPPVVEANLSACHPSHLVLFEPVQIGPVTAPNRFYQVPHASGMTETHPRVRAAFRETKAEGGWGVVSTGAVSIHPSSDDSPLPFARLWSDADTAHTRYPPRRFTATGASPPWSFGTVARRS